MKRSSFLTALALVALLSACGKRPGGSCKPREDVCSNKTTALSCRDGKFVEVACHGPLGCTTFQEKAHCDASEATEGQACMNEGDEEYACSVDKKRALFCKNGKFERYLECRGKSGCAMLGRQVSCDTSVSENGDPCKVQGAAACTASQKELVICRDGKFVHHRSCRGPAGCYTKDEAPACDETLAQEQDACGVTGFLACSEDGKTELICQGGRFMRSRDCRVACTVVAGGHGGVDCR